MSENKRIIPKEWFDFEDWLEDRAKRAKKTSDECDGTNEVFEHYEFVRREWISYIAETIRNSKP